MTLAQSPEFFEKETAGPASDSPISFSGSVGEDRLRTATVAADPFKVGGSLIFFEEAALGPYELGGEDKLEKKFCGKVGEDQQHEAPQRPPDGMASSPSELTAPNEKDGKRKPRNEREDAVVRKGEERAKKLFGKEETTNEGKGEERKTYLDHLKHQGFHGLHRRYGTHGLAWVTPTQAALLDPKHQALYDRDAQETVG